eukprot:comp19697_c0_seq1/m.37827 comp19697_c0_seq1/g.37827  ORF comp19697_c0_seq1/g.37827 comp19697_c0_seq1/m.37827 type:complete len:274 (-) comp19697_c0_seq1:50-871(-)
MSTEEPNVPTEDTAVPKKNDGVERLFAPVNLSRIQQFLLVTTILLILIAIGMLIVGGLTNDRSVREQNIISGCVMIIACVISIASSRLKDRGGLQLTYLLYVWQLGNGSVILYSGLNSNSKYNNLCDTAGGADASCGTQKRLAKALAGLGFLSFFIGLATAWLVSNLSEKIQDEHSNLLRAKDIRFAIAAQHAKSKAVNRWQKNYGTNVKGKFGSSKGPAENSNEPQSVKGSDNTPSSSRLESSSGMRRQDTKPGAIGIPALPHLTPAGNLPA